MKYKAVYMYDTEELPGYIKDRFKDAWIEAEVPRENIHVARYGSEGVENMTEEELLERDLKLEDYPENTPYSDSDPMMYLHVGSVPEERIVAEKW